MPKILSSSISVGDIVSFTKTKGVSRAARFEVTRSPYVSRRLKEVSLIHKWIRVKCLDNRVNKKGKILMLGVRQHVYLKFHNK